MRSSQGMIKLDFELSPFYLYPIDKEHLEKLFINREAELKVIRSIFQSSHEQYSEICSVIGGIGEGKSSTLNYALKIAEEKDFKVAYSNGREGLAEKTARENEVLILDDMDKLGDEEAEDFYREAETLIKDCQIIIFSDTNERRSEALKLRDFTVSQDITLPKFLTVEEFSTLLEQRMKNCLTSESSFEFPFDDQSIEMASLRAGSNLRSFLKYTKNAWNLLEDGKVNMDTMEKGISLVDRNIIDRLGKNGLKLLWVTTDNELNKSYTAELCGMDRSTLDRKIDGPLKELIETKKEGRSVKLTSIYSRVPRGKKILRRVYKKMGIDIEKLV